MKAFGDAALFLTRWFISAEGVAVGAAKGVAGVEGTEDGRVGSVAGAVKEWGLPVKGVRVGNGVAGVAAEVEVEAEAGGTAGRAGDGSLSLAMLAVPISPSPSRRCRSSMWSLSPSLPTISSSRMPKSSELLRELLTAMAVAVTVALR
jgi:hypothetical protein